MKNEECRRIDDNNRILIPKWLRKALGLGPGDLLKISLQGGSITLQRVEEE